MTWYKDYLDAWNRLDLDTIVTFVTDDVNYEDTTLGHGAQGKDQLKKFIRASFANVPDARFDFVSGYDNGDGYAIEWVMQPMGVRGVSVGRLRDGKIAENRDYWNGMSFTVPNT